MRENLQQPQPSLRTTPFVRFCSVGMWSALASSTAAHLCWRMPAQAGCDVPAPRACSTAASQAGGTATPGTPARPVQPAQPHSGLTLLPTWSKWKQKIPSSSLHHCKDVLYEVLPPWAGQPCSQHILALTSAFFCEVSPWLSAADELLWDKDRWNKGTILSRDFPRHLEILSPNTVLM